MVRQHEETTLELAGETYRFTIPKIAPVISAMIRMRDLPPGRAEVEMAYAQAQWVRRGLGEQAWARVNERLEDDNDPLDWPHLSQAFQVATAQSGQRPTMSSPASMQPSQATTFSEGEPRQNGSTYGS